MKKIGLVLFATILVALMSINEAKAQESAINADTGVFLTVRHNAGADMVLAKCRELSEQGLLAEGMTTEDCRNVAIFSEEIKDGLVVIFPVTTLGEYADRVTKVLRAEIDEQEKQIATKAGEVEILQQRLAKKEAKPAVQVQEQTQFTQATEVDASEARREFIKARRAQIAAEAAARLAMAKARKAEAVLKSATIETDRNRAELAKLRQEKAELASRLGASQRAFGMQVAILRDLQKDLSIGLRTKISNLMKAFDEFAGREPILAGLRNEFLLVLLGSLVMVLLLIRRRATDEARARIIQRVKDVAQVDLLSEKNMKLMAELAKFSTEPRPFSLPDAPDVRETFVLSAVGFNKGTKVFSYQAACGAFVEEAGIPRHLDEIHNDGPTRRAARKDPVGPVKISRPPPCLN